MMMEKNNYYLNNPQARALLIDAPKMILIYGRRLGKSTEIIAHLSIKRIFEMPGALFLLLGRTYKQLLERTLPSTQSGWRKRGYVEGIHYVIGKKPPRVWRQPLYRPSSWEHSISWFNGTVFALGSQDREGLVNSLTTFGLFADEAKFLREDRFKEDALPTISAPTHFFPGNPHNRFLVLCTSMPDLPEGQWIFDYEKLMNKNACECVLQASLHLEQLRYQISISSSEKEKLYLKSLARQFENELKSAREGLVFFDEASTFSNVHILGMDYLRDQKDILKDKFIPEILNLRPDRGKKSFYGNLSSVHKYNDYNYSHIDSLSFNLEQQDCRFDNDVIRTLPLIIGMDFGANINCIVTAQRLDSLHVFKTIKNHYVVRPRILDDVCEDWCSYYRFHQNKRVAFWYDSSGNNAQANSKLTYAQQAERIFRKNGWEVEMKTTGGANSLHHKKFLLINTALSGKDPRYPAVLFNESNCEELLESMMNAPAVKDKNNLIHKVKTSERSKNVPPQYATHLSDAWDCMFFGEFNSSLSSYEMRDPFNR